MFNLSPYSYALQVSNVKEAETAPIDYTGNPVFYFNNSENEVYIKRFDMGTGKTFFGKYAFVPVATEEPKNDFKILNDKLDYLYQLLENKEPKAKENKKAAKDDE